jgi:hypothetical protein
MEKMTLAAPFLFALGGFFICAAMFAVRQHYLRIIFLIAAGLLFYWGATGTIVHIPEPSVSPSHSATPSPGST